MRGQQRGEVAVVGPHQLHDLGVLDLVETEAAVLGGDLHAEGAEPLQPVDHGLWVLTRAVDLFGVDLLGEETLETRAEFGEFRPLGTVGERVDQARAEIAEEQLADETRLFPLFFARVLGDFARLALGLG